MNPGEVLSLSLEIDWILWESITVIEAQEMLKDLTVSSFPNYSKQEKSKLHRKLHRQAYPANFSEQIELTPEALARALGG
jgi:hypothetical protein